MTHDQTSSMGSLRNWGHHGALLFVELSGALMRAVALVRWCTLCVPRGTCCCKLPVVVSFTCEPSVQTTRLP